MSDIAEFGIGGFRSTKTILNYCSSGGVNVSGLNASAYNNSKEVLSGALSAGVLATALSVTGAAGELGYLAVYAKDTTSRTVRIKVTVDGLTPVVFDATSSAVTVAGSGLMVVGNIPSNPTPVGAVTPLRWTSSLLVEIASSRAESGTGNDQIAIAYNMSKV